MVLLVETANEAVANDATLVSAGWTPFSSSPQGTGTAAGTTATRLTSYYKRHTGTESNPNLGDAGNHTGGIVMVFRGCKASGSPIDADAGSVASSASTSVSCPTITTTGADRMVVAAVAWSTDSASAQTSSWTNANLTGLTERQDSGSTAGNGGGISVATGVMATAGAVGATTATLGTSSVQGRLQFALIPEPIADGDHTVTANDSGSNYAQKSTWPPTTTDYVGDDDGGTTIYVSRNLSGGTYTVDTAYLLFDLSTLSGGSPVSAAKLRVYLKAKTDNDARYGIRAEIYDFGGTSTSDDWVAEVTSPVTATSLLSATAASNYIEMDLTDLTAVSALGVVGFRITMATTGTAEPSAVNVAQLGSHTDTNKPQLVVTLTSGGGGIDQAAGTATETDSAFTAGRVKNRATVTATETDVAPSAGRTKSKVVGTAIETDTAANAPRVKSRVALPASEGDGGVPAARGKGKTAGTAAETDTPTPAARRKTRSTGTASEGDAAATTGRVKTRAVNPSLEVDAAFGAGSPTVVPAGPAAEGDSAVAVGRVKRRTIGTAVEADTSPAAARRKTRQTSTAGETDAGAVVARRKARAPAPAGETGQALSVTRRKTRVVASAVTVDSPVAVVRVKARGLGVPAEFDDAFTIGRVKVIVVGTPAETDEAFPLILGPGQLAGFGVVSAVYRTATITAARRHAASAAAPGHAAAAATAALRHMAPTVTAHHHTAPTITGDH